MVVVAPGPLLPLEAPLPEPRLYDLLGTALVTERSTDRWLGGAWTGGEIPGPVFTHDPCATGTDRAKQGAGEIADQQAATFVAYLPAFCDSRSIGPDPEAWLERMRTAFERYESSAVERVLATGDGHDGAHLTDANLELLNSGGAIDATMACGLLEQAVAKHGGGLIHIGARTSATWLDRELIAAENGTMRTGLGTRVIVGYGYANARPIDGNAAGPTQEWAFATGPIEIIRDPEITITPPTFAEALDRSMNDVLYLAERPYLLNWIGRTSEDDEDHTQAGVLVELAPVPGNFIVINGGGGGASSYTVETPAGVIDGINDTFTLSVAPVPPIGLLLWKNGLFMQQTVDYTLVGTTITFDPLQIPTAGSNLVAAIPT